MPKVIPLTQGMEALVDDRDYEMVSRHSWRLARRSSVNYAVTTLGKRPNRSVCLMHRMIMGLGPGDSREVDHLNYNGLDNQRENLRIVTHHENMYHRRMKGHSKAGQKFRARIYIDGKELHLGVWDDSRMARAAYLCAKQIFHPIGGETG